MKFLRNHWFDIGAIWAIIILVILVIHSHNMTDYQILMWLSVVSLLFHQFEEYHLPGTFPGMVNKVMFKSDLPARYPLNPNTSLIINVYIGWVLYLSAAILGKDYLFLGIASMLVSLGNIIAHTLIFNIKGKTIYNAGLVTCWLLFAPCIIKFIQFAVFDNYATLLDYLIGIPLGGIINIIGILKLITWLADRKTPYVFLKRQLLPIDQK